MLNSKPKAAARPQARTSKLWATVRELAARPAGVSLAELRTNGGNVQHMLKTLVAEGALHRVQLNAKVVRYFVHKADADRLDALRNAPLPSVRAAAAPRHRAPWSADAPMVITPQTKITVAPTPPRALRSNTHWNF